MNENEWRVIAQRVGGRVYWFVVKPKTEDDPHCVGSRIYKGGHFDSELDAQKYADFLNIYGGNTE